MKLVGVGLCGFCGDDVSVLKPKVSMAIEKEDEKKDALAL